MSRTSAATPAAARAPLTGGFWLAAAAFAGLVVATQAADRSAPLMRGLGFGLIGLAALLAGLPLLQLRRHGAAAAGAPFGATTVVARRGLYAVVRHPQYLGGNLLAWGVAALALSWATILPAIACSTGLSLQARAEEQYLLERFGDDYRTYRRTVPRFGLFTGLVRYLRRRGAAAGHEE